MGVRPNYLEQSRLQDYQEGWGNILTTWKEAPLKPQMQPGFGPIYYIATSSGRELAVHPYFVQNVSKGSLPYSQKKWNFVIEDYESGGIIGRASASLEIRRDPVYRINYYGVIRNISLKQRGCGVCIPVELVRSDLLQREANQTGINIVCQIINSNANQLLHWRGLAKATKDPNIVEVVEEMQKEQDRWQHVYGPNGVLGVDKFGKLIFTPNDEAAQKIALETLEEVRLTRMRVMDGDRELAKPEVVWQNDILDTCKFQSERARHLTNVILPKINQITTFQ